MPSLSNVAALALSLAGAAVATTHTVTVGSGDIVYAPATLQAAVGDEVLFNFVNITHSVTEGSFEKPCEPLNSTSFHSGFIDANQGNFTITVKNSDPIWYYCAYGPHCQYGMVGVINPPANRTQKEFAAAAEKATAVVTPSAVTGGVLALASTPSASATSSVANAASSAATTPSASASAAPGTGAAGTIEVASWFLGVAAAGAIGFAL